MLKSTACLPKNYMTAFVLSFFGSPFLPRCNSEHKTAAARWQLWTFHLPVISQRSESSICLSEPSLCLTSAASLVCSHWHHPAALFFLPPRLDSIRGEIFWWEVSSRWLLFLQSFECFQVFKSMYIERRGGGSFKQISHLWINLSGESIKVCYTNISASWIPPDLCWQKRKH